MFHSTHPNAGPRVKDFPSDKGFGPSHYMIDRTSTGNQSFVGTCLPTPHAPPEPIPAAIPQFDEPTEGTHPARQRAHARATNQRPDNKLGIRRTINR